MYNRYNKTNILTNNSPEYSSLLERKKLKILNQYATFDFNNLKNLPYSNLEYVMYEFKANDRMYNLSQKFYGSPEYGWLILYTNGLKSELDLYPSLYINIYFPLDELLRLI